MSNQTATEKLVLGGWTPYHNLTPQDKVVFDEATKGLIGLKYTPQTVSNQVVEGTNYRYKCLASLPQADVVWEAIAEIYKPLNGNPHVTDIISL